MPVDQNAPVSLNADSLLAFEQELRDEGFVEIQSREIDPGTRNAAHSHAFEVKALMLGGELHLSCGGESTTFQAGEIFTMAAGREHEEQFGALGASYLAGRKYPS